MLTRGPLAVSYTHLMLIIPNLGETMKAYTDEDWTSWKKEFSDLLISRLYLGATVEPTDFFNSRLKKANGKDDATAIFADAWLEDPDGKYLSLIHISASRRSFRNNREYREDDVL